MPRTTAIKVKEILSTTLSDAIVDAFILGANEIVTQVLGDDTDLTDAHKAEVERWLSAHLIASTRERQAKQEGAGGANITYQGETGIAGLSGTMYGQQAMLLDTTGKLALSDGVKKQASVYAVPSFDN